MNRCLMLCLSLWLLPNLAQAAWSNALVASGVSPASAVKVHQVSTKSVAGQKSSPATRSAAHRPTQRYTYRKRAWHYPKTDSRRFGGRARR